MDCEDGTNPDSRPMSRRSEDDFGGGPVGGDYYMVMVGVCDAVKESYTVFGKERSIVTISSREHISISIEMEIELDLMEGAPMRFLRT